MFFQCKVLCIVEMRICINACKVVTQGTGQLNTGRSTFLASQRCHSESGGSACVEWTELEGAQGRVVLGCSDSGSVSLNLQMQCLGCIRKLSLEDCAADAAGFVSGSAG